MTFGTAKSVEDVPSYLSRVRGGAPVAEALATEFQRRFSLIGGSPLTRITQAQASALEGVLNAGRGADAEFHVSVGMRFSAPTIGEGLSLLRDGGARRVVGIVLSPQYSPVVLGGYLRDVQSAREAVAPGLSLRVAQAWNEEPLFLDALAARLSAALAQRSSTGGERYVLFTAHSLPCRVATQAEEYLEQLRWTAGTVAARVGLTAEQWRFVYQSAGHTGEDWLTPDVRDVLPELRQRGYAEVLIAPVQFLADHLEVLYDIDVAARAEAADVGMQLSRVESLNAMPLFVDALAAVVRRELERWD